MVLRAADMEMTLVQGKELYVMNGAFFGCLVVYL